MKTSREYFLESAVLSVEERFGIEISLEKITEIIGDKMASEWTNFEYTEASPYMDTSPCEDVADLIAHHYIGRGWPTYGDREMTFQEFEGKLLAAMKKDAA